MLLLASSSDYLKIVLARRLSSIAARRNQSLSISNCMHGVSSHESQTARIPNGIQRGDLQNTMPRLWSSLHWGDRETCDHKSKGTPRTLQYRAGAQLIYYHEYYYFYRAASGQYNYLRIYPYAVTFAVYALAHLIRCQAHGQEILIIALWSCLLLEWETSSFGAPALNLTVVTFARISEILTQI